MKNIAIIAGGDSSEYEVSLKSAKGLFGFIDQSRYHLYLVLIHKGFWTVEIPDGRRPEIDKKDFSFFIDGEKIKFDFAYITIHGRPGEDGRLQGYFDMIGVPYSSCGVFAGALTFNKYVNNQFLKTQGVRVADAILLKGNIRRENGENGERETRGIEEVVSRLGLPVFVKPNEGGSSFGVTKVKEASQMLPAIEKAFSEGDEVIIERFIEGTEVTCGCYKTQTKTVVFPITEVVSENEFFDYNAKYKGEVQEITPARISDELTAVIQQETLRIYDLINAKGIIRIDYIISTDNQLFILEINTNPGMTETSFIPQQIKASGLNIKDVMADIIEDA
jgi:D-alanine-D-alanine ligase